MKTALVTGTTSGIGRVLVKEFLDRGWEVIAPVYLRRMYASHPVLRGVPAVFTIHNLAYQGIFESDWLPRLDLGWDELSPDRLEFWGRISLLKGGIVDSSVITTVSRTYAREIQTPETGFGFDGILRARSADLVGILNGIDTDEWNPATDKHLPATFDAADMSGKAVCKAALQKEAGLAVRPDVPVFGIIGRLTPQKGFDVLAHALARILNWDVQMVLLGTGDADAERFFAWADAHHGDRFRAWLRFDNGRAHRIEAGGDFFLMPSRFEPCGLNQMYSQRYGTPPVVHDTGGLHDSVVDCRPVTLADKTATGFLFESMTADSFLVAMQRAVAAYYDKKIWRQLQKNGMARDFSWDASAQRYVLLYQSLIPA
jgi:starch synthase